MTEELRVTSWEETQRKRAPRREKVAELAKRMEAQERAYNLREIRQYTGLTQNEVAARLQLSQPTISSLERGDLERSSLDTLRAYIEALGGTVEVIATFGDKRLVLA